MPIAHLFDHGDYQFVTRESVMEYAQRAGLTVERFEVRKGMRLHCVVRKP